jgi:6-phosphogluconolactonase (cycloisomerase 2 family)
MSFLRAARAALAGQNCLPRILVALTVVVVVVLTGFSLSCGGSTPPPLINHSAYVTLPSSGSVLLLQINSTTGAITLGAETPAGEGLTPTGIALIPSRKFLYAVNSFANTISIFTVHSDGTLTLSGAPIPAGGSSPNVARIDPSGNYLLVTNNLSNNISVFSIGAGGATLTPVPQSPFPANATPTEILFSHSGQFVYVSNPSIGMVTGFSFANGVLTTIPGSPFSSGSTGGATGLAVDSGDRFLYVANPSATNVPPFQATTGNISAYNIDPNTGALSTLLGSPFASLLGSGPTQLVVDTSGKFLYAVTPGSSSSIWCFTITSTSGQLAEVAGSPFSFAAGSLFALIDPIGTYLYIGSQSGTAIEGYTYNLQTGAPTLISGSPFSTKVAPGRMVLSEQ